MPKTQKKKGIVQSFNVSPKGSYEGILLKEGTKVVQVNFGPHFAHELPASLKIGAKVEAEVTEFVSEKPKVHPVFELVSLDGGDTFDGIVKRLNYALHGEVNGGILDSGDFLHLKPKGATELGIKVGMKLKGTGRRKPMVGGNSVIEASEVNGVKIEQKPKPKKS